LACLLVPGVGYAGDGDWSGPIRLWADRCEVSDVAGRIRAEGRVRVALADRTITADAVLCRFVRDPVTGRRIITQLTASGGVALIESRRLASGDMVDADVSGRELTMDREAGGTLAAVTDARLRLTERGDRALVALFQGSSIEFIDRGLQRTVVVREGTLTGCDRPDPHYCIEAREIELTEGQFVIARHAAVRLWGTKIVSLPVLRFGLGEASDHSPVPRLGVTKTSGPFVRWLCDLPSSRRGTYDLLLQYSTRRSATWRLRAEGTQRLRLFVHAAAKEEMFGRRERGIVVSTLPQVGVRAIAGPFVLTADYGYYREAPSGVHERRRNIEASYESPQWSVASWARLWLGAGVRRAWYPSGDPFEMSVGDVSGEIDLSPATTLRLGYRRASTNHKTPFLFDDVDLEDEARVGLRIGRRWGALDFLVRYDMDDHRVFGYDVSFTRNEHCLAPRLTYSSRDRSVGLEIGIPGL
jgi:hypothetical protein